MDDGIPVNSATFADEETWLELIETAGQTFFFTHAADRFSGWTRGANSWLQTSALSHSCFRVPSIFTCWSGNYRQVQRTGFVQDVRSVLQPLFKQFHGISLASVRRPHLLRRAACWICQPSLSRFRRIFFEFLPHLASICHLENAEIFYISVVMAFSPSEAIVSERFLKFTFVNARPLWFTSLSSPQKIASSVSLYGCAVFWYVFTFSLAGKMFRFCVERFLRLCELTTGIVMRTG